MTAVDLLLEEHRLIERMLTVLEESAGRLERNEPVPPAMLAGMLEFLRAYADAGHHAKEEDIFFPALARHGVDPRDGPVGAFTAQHELGRTLMDGMREALPGVDRGDGEAGQAFAAVARDYVALLREHIHLEDRVFVRYALEFLSADEDAALRERMDALDLARAGTGDRYRRMVADYEEALLTC